MSVTFKVHTPERDAALRAYAAGDDEEAEYPDFPEVNVSNANAGRVLAALGIPFDYDGTIEGQDLMDRLDVVEPAIAEHGAGPMVDADRTLIAGRVLSALGMGQQDGPTIIDASPDATDYLLRRLPYFRMVAEESIRTGIAVTWS